jgi:hypothetical protein
MANNMRTRKELLKELLDDITTASSNEMVSRAYLTKINETLLDIRELLQEQKLQYSLTDKTGLDPQQEKIDFIRECME